MRFGTSFYGNDKNWYLHTFQFLILERNQKSQHRGCQNRNFVSMCHVPKSKSQHRRCQNKNLMYPNTSKISWNTVSKTNFQNDKKMNPQKVLFSDKIKVESSIFRLR